ncbi:hypothetical protein CQW23_35288 [Capsicum baccatum]|uniref:Protein TAR1 n=1 Tax=Capsicum baccatum TaxID=33114 RepID=A0A2G2UWC5_CAPBA|nr:hypothetical protein CQW23_35288 [Capsicum baccatum]
MIGRADIEGSKSNVAMNAWLPQASYPCGNFSDTSSFEFRRSKGSLGHAFTMCRPSQTPHLTMSSARIGPQSEPWVQKEGQCPASDSRNNRIPLVRTSSELAVRRAGKAPEGTVPSPSPGRHAATRSRRGSSSSSPPTADGFGTGTPVPSPQSQSFSRSYGSILPTSLAYIVPSTRGCSPWRPDAVMSTTGRGRHSVLRIFKGRRERTGHHATCGALPAAGPYLRLSRFQGGQAVCSHSNLSQKIKVGWRCTPRGNPTNQLPCTLRVYSPVDSHTCQTPWFVFQDGSNGEPTGQRPERADAEARRRRALPATIEETAFHERIKIPGFGRPPIHAGPRPRSIGVPARRRSTYDRGTSSAPIRFPPDNFKHSLTLFAKSFSSFPRGSGHDGAITLSGPPLRTLLQTTIRTTESPDSKAGLFPIRSPLLKESFAKGSWSTDARRVVAATAKRVELQPPLSATSVDMDSHLGQPRVRGAREASIRPATTTRPVFEARCEGATQCVMTRQTFPRPNGFGRNLHSKTRWFTGFCNSHQVSHFTMFFIDTRSEISVAESRFRLQKKHRSPRRTPRMGREGQAIDSSITWRFPRRGSLVARLRACRGRGEVLVRSARAPRPRGLPSC